MNQHNSNVGPFDPNQNIAHHIVYDTSQQQQQPRHQIQQHYVMQGYDLQLVDSSAYMVQNPHQVQVQVQGQPMVSYAGAGYSDNQQINIPTYYDPNMTQHHVVYEQHSPVSGAQAVNMGHQLYYDTGSSNQQQTGYVHYSGQSGGDLHQNQYGQRDYGNLHSGMILQTDNASMMGHVQQQMRPQPMTAEQIQLSQQRLLGLARPQQQQQIPQQQPAPQMLQQQQIQQIPQIQQISQIQQIPQPTQQHQILIVQQQQVQQPQQQQPIGNYGGQIFNAPAPVPVAPSHGSPAGSSYTSSGTDISDEGDETFGVPSPYKRSPPGDSTAKRHGKKRKAHKDPNEPQKPVSAYALFFRDTQAAIKGQNPSATFGDVSKIVASMWDNLDADGKNIYKQKTELAKKDYLKQLAAYRANLLSKGNHSTAASVTVSPIVQYSDQQPQQPQRKMSAQGQQWMTPLETTSTTASMEIGGKTLASLISEPKPPQFLTATTSSVFVQQTPVLNRPTKQEYVVKPEPMILSKPDGACIRANCQNPAVECSQWDGEYCTDDCVSKNCRDIFSAWVQSKQPQPDIVGPTIPS